MAKEDIELRGEIVGETELAIRFKADGEHAVWLPREAVAVVNDTDNKVLVTMPWGMARRKGLA